MTSQYKKTPKTVSSHFYSTHYQFSNSGDINIFDSKKKSCGIIKNSPSITSKPFSRSKRILDRIISPRNAKEKIYPLEEEKLNSHRKDKKSAIKKILNFEQEDKKYFINSARHTNKRKLKAAVSSISPLSNMLKNSKIKSQKSQIYIQSFRNYSSKIMQESKQITQPISCRNLKKKKIDINFQKKNSKEKYKEKKEIQKSNSKNSKSPKKIKKCTSKEISLKPGLNNQLKDLIEFSLSPTNRRKNHELPMLDSMQSSPNCIPQIEKSDTVGVIDFINKKKTVKERHDSIFSKRLSCIDQTINFENSPKIKKIIENVKKDNIKIETSFVSNDEDEEFVNFLDGKFNFNNISHISTDKKFEPLILSKQPVHERERQFNSQEKIDKKAFVSRINPKLQLKLAKIFLDADKSDQGFINLKKLKMVYDDDFAVLLLLKELETQLKNEKVKFDFFEWIDMMKHICFDKKELLSYGSVSFKNLAKKND